jgi:hypothetical protein
VIQTESRFPSGMTEKGNGKENCKGKSNSLFEAEVDAAGGGEDDLDRGAGAGECVAGP